MKSSSFSGRRKRVVASVCAVSLVAIAGCGSDDSQASGDEDEVFYDGKSIELIVPSNPGGAIDVAARLAAQHLGKYLAGEPEITVLNTPGGNQIAGANDFALRTEPDGQTLFINGNGLNTAQLFDIAGKQFDYSDWYPLLGFVAGNVVMSLDDSGVTKAEELLDPDAELIYGGLNPAGTDIAQVLAFELFGLDYEPVFGYENNSAIAVAMQQGEVTLRADAPSQAFKELGDLIEDGTVHPIFTLGLPDGSGGVKRDPSFPDIPTAHETYQLLHGEPLPDSMAAKAFETVLASRSIGYTIWVKNEAPEEAKKALEAAVKELAEDAEFQEGVKNLGVEVVVGAENLEGPVQSVLEADPEVLDWVRDFLKTEFDTEID